MAASLKGSAGGYDNDQLRTLLTLHAIALREMAQGLCLLDAEFRIVLFNRRLVEIIGIAPELVRVGVPVQVLFTNSGNEENSPHSTSGEMWSEIAEMFAQGTPFRLQRKFSKNAVIAFQFQPITGGGWVAICDELTAQPVLDTSRQVDFLKQVVENVSHGLCVFDADRNLTMCNERYLTLYGYDRAFIKPGVGFQDILNYAAGLGIYSATTADKLDEIGALSRREELSQVINLSDGRFIEARSLPIATGGWLTEHRDITRKVSHERNLQNRKQLLDAALDHMAHGLCAFDDQLNLIVTNRRYLDIYGLTLEDAQPGTPMIDLIRRSVARGVHCAGIDAEQMFADLKMRLIENKEPELLRQLANGDIIAVRHQPMLGGGWVGTYEDITERYKAQQNIAHIARHDALTELPNRLLFGEKMIEALARVSEKKETMAVMCFDLDNFKAVNDSLGHPIGDKLLQQLAGRLCAAARSNDTIARLGGDEFAVIQPGVNAEEAEALARRLINATSRAFVIDGHEIHASICIGVATAPEHGSTVDQLMKCADLALYRAKAQGRSTWRFFDPEMDVEIQARRALEVDLHRAFVANEFHLNFQPLINLTTNEIVGMEALVRWTHPDRGEISPAEFIPIAEETGLIVPLGEWIIRQACAEARKWPTRIKLAVNLSPVQFRNRALVPIIINALAAEGLSAARLELEITEAALMQNDDSVVNMLHQLRGLGVRIAMDDFGTGYSSLSYLRKFPFDRIKIDQSFIADSDTNADSAVIVRTIAALGKALGIETTAEGIESVEQLELVRQAGCTEGQGYLIGRPRSAAEVREFVSELYRLVTAA